MACKTISVLSAATPQVAIPSRLPQTQADWQAVVQQLNTMFTQVSQSISRPAATSVPVQYATLISSTLPPLQTSGCTVTADNTWSLFGGYSYKVQVTATNAYVIFGASGFPCPIPPNENWLFSLYGKCSGSAQQFKAGLQTANGTYENTMTTDATATTVDRFAIPLNLVADNASSCTVRFDFPSAVGETFNFDGIQYEPAVTGVVNPSPFLSTNIIAGSIIAQFISVANLSALSANMGTLTAGKIASTDGRFTIDCTGELITITDGTNTRMEIGQVSAGVYDIKIWNGSGVLLFDAATGLQYAGNSTQVTQVVGNNAGSGQLNVNPAGGVTNTLPYSNNSGPVTTTIAGTVDTNGSYLQHGTVYDPHISAAQIKWRHLLGDTSGDTVTYLVDGGFKRFLHGSMSLATQDTIAGTVDTNGSYLQHGVVFQPHIHANQIGWGHFVGDTSGNYSGNLVDALNLRFLHSAMSTPAQATLASTAGGDGSYLNTSQIFNRHLASASQSGLADDASAKMFRFGTLAGRPAAGTAGRIYHASDAGTNGITYRDSGTAWIEVGVGHLADINGTTDNLAAGASTNVVNQTNLTLGNVDLSKSGVANRVLSNIADDATYTKTLGSVQTGNVPDLGKGILGKHLGNIADDLTGSGRSAHVVGTLASRPAAGTSGRTYLATNAGTQGILYRDTGTAWVEAGVGHLADINGTTDNVTEGANKFAAEHGADITGNHTSALTASLSNQDQSKLADDPAGVWLRFKGTQQTAILTNQAANHILDPGFTSIADFWGNVYSASAGVLNQGTVGAGGSVSNFNYDGRGNLVKVKLDPGDTLVLQLTSTQAPTGTASTHLTAEFQTAAGGLISYANAANVPATGTGTGTSVTPAPATCAYAYLYIETKGNASGGNAALVTSPQARINHETVADVNALKAYVNASDTTSGGHTGTWQHSFMSSGVQSAIASSGSIVNVCSALNNTEQGTAFDGSAVTFLTAFPAGTSPIIVYLPGGLTYDSTLPAGSQQQAFSVTGLSNTGFMPVLKIQNIPAAPTNQSVNFTPYNTATNSATATLSVPGGTTIINGAMTVNFSVTLPLDSSDTVTITVAGTSEWSKNLVTGSSGKTFTYSIPVTNTAAVNGSTVVVADNVGISGVKATTVTYQTGTAATTHSATPAGANGVPFIVLPPPT